MNREQVYNEIKEMCGIVPSFFKVVPDSTLEMEWRLFRQIQLEESVIPNKYKELIGLGIAAVSKCRYCALFHTEAAKLNGATQAEIEDALHYAKSSAGWSAYINGLQLDYDEFKDEIRQITDYVRSQSEKREKVSVR